MRKFLFAAFIFILKTAVFSESGFFNYVNDKNYAEYTLENGMQIFVMEDFSSAPVRIEYSVHAGISAQNAANTGFFPLYTRLFKYASNESSENFILEDLHSECNADSSRYTISSSPELLSEIFKALSQNAFAPVFTEKDIKREYSKLKTEVMQYAPTPAAFINTAIDSRIFQEAPWKQDYGIYPQIFSNAKPSQIRTILANIGKFWYTPQNSALFVSGSVTKETVYALAEKYFGQYKAAATYGTPEAVRATGKAKKFVMHDIQFSEEMTQIVVEYTTLSLNQSNLAAATFNSDYSSLKNTLCQNHLLNIRGPEYINAASTNQNGCSRLIFQTLLEQNKRSAVEQAENFILTIKNAAEITKNQEFRAAKQYVNETFNSVTANSSSFMNFLSEFWSIYSLLPKNDENGILLAQKLLNRPEEITNLDIESLKTSFKNEIPFVFVLVNTKNFNKYKKDYERLGYEEINSKNSSWYAQELFKNAAKEIKFDENEENSDFITAETNLKNNQNIFVEQNKNSIQKFELSNGIPVTVKTNRITSDVAILISIDGGKLADKNRPGFQNVMAKAFAANIQKEINKYKMQQMIFGFPQISTETGYSESSITVECAKQDIALCIRSIADALIFGEINPAEADSYVYSVQTQKRLSDASPVNQMNFRAFKYFYDSTYIRNIFDSEKDILQKTSYNDILAYYPKLLDASLYSIVICGNTDAEAVRYVLNESLGVLAAQTKRNDEKRKEFVPEPDFPAKIRKINLKIRHLFYTDVKAEDAGPMPAILVPTKNFADPLEYWFKAPKLETNLTSTTADNSEYILFEAVLFRFAENLNKNGVEAKLFAPTKEFNCAGLCFLSVEHTDFVEQTYKNTLKEFAGKLQDENSFETERIKNAWILNKLSETETNKGTAKLLCYEQNLLQSYIENYQTIANAKSADFLQILSKYFPAEPLLQIYSSDAKK